MSEGNREPGTSDGDLIRRGVRLVAGFVRVHPWSFAAAVTGSVCFAVGTVLSATMLGWLTDHIILPAFDEGEAGRTRRTVLLAVIGVAVLRSAGVVGRRYFAGMTSFRTRNDLQRRLGDHYLDMPAADLRVAPKGRLLAHVDSDVNWATDALNPLPFTIGVFTLIGVSIVSLALVDWVPMLVAIGMIPLIAGLNRLNASLAERPAVAVRESVAVVSSVASESFDGALIVKTLGREDAELERFTAAAEELRDHSVELGRIRAVFTAVLDLIPDLGVVTLVVLGAWRTANGHMTPGQLVQTVALFGILVFPLRVIGFFFGDLPPAVVAHDRIARILAGRQREPAGERDLPPGALDVHVRDVSVRYGDGAAVDAVSLHVEAGETLALVGPTGCGKSSLLSAMTNMVPLSGGAIDVGGVPLTEISGGSLTGRVAVAWQEPFLLDASAADNIRFGARSSLDQVMHAATIARFHDVALALPDGYETKVGERGVRLSGGQRQRLALARAIVRRPGLLLLDDATSAVDPVIEQEILGGIGELGTTMVIVAHRRSTIMLADRVAMMQGGRVTALGTHDDLLAVPEYVALLQAYDTEATYE